MFIKHLRINNFKGFGDSENEITFQTPNGLPGSGLNILIGENNCGKSTVFEALNFIKEGSKKDLATLKNKTSVTPDFFVECVFSGAVSETIDNHGQENKRAIFKSLIEPLKSGEESIKVRRTGSTADADLIKKIAFWNPSNSSFENPTGIDAPFKKLYDNNFIWADTNAEDEAKFGASTFCGSLLREIADGHTSTAEYQRFSSEFHNVFNNPESTLRKSLSNIESEINSYLNSQFGIANIKFHFEELAADSFFKSTSILIDDGIEVPMTEKGHGLQRSVALALLQVYSSIVSRKDSSKTAKPFFFLIDEPEICLHPIAQSKLLDSLIEISKTKQVFLTTHSPFLIKSAKTNNIGLFIFKKNNNKNKVEKADLNKIFNWGPTWGEIIFKAYNLPNEDFHNELYGHLQNITQNSKEEKIDEFLLNQGMLKNKNWTR